MPIFCQNLQNCDSVELEGDGEAWLLGKTFPIIAEDVYGTIIEPPSQGPGLIKVEDDQHEDTVFFMVDIPIQPFYSPFFVARCTCLSTTRRA